MVNNISKDYINFIEKLRQGNRKELHDASVRWNELANKKSTDLSKHLFAVASLVLPLSFIPVTDNTFLSNMPLYGHWLLVASWICFIVSLVTGILHLNIEANFFNKWSEQENARSKAYSEGIFTTSPITAFERLDKMGKKSSSLMKMKVIPTNKFFYSQQAFLVLGIILVGIVLTVKIFCVI